MRRLTVPTLAAARHEALFIRLAALLAEAQAIGRRRPELAVPADTRRVAEALLFEAQGFATPRPSRRRPRQLPPCAEHFAGLALQLGQALAGLEAFEAAHSAWNADLGCFVWLVERDAVLPVQRLRPQTNAVLKTAADDKRAARRRKEVLRLLCAKVSDGYERGYADALAGRPALPEDILGRF